MINYKLTNEKGEVKVFCGQKRAAEFLGCVPSTIHVYAKTDKLIKGWKVDLDGICDCHYEPKYKSIRNSTAKNPRKQYIDNDLWHYNRITEPVLTVQKSIRTRKEFDGFEAIEEQLKKAVRIYLNADNHYLKQYYVFIKTPTFRVERRIDESIIYFELHVKPVKFNSLIEEIRYIKPYLNKLEDYIKRYVDYDILRNRNNTNQQLEEQSDL